MQIRPLVDSEGRRITDDAEKIIGPLIPAEIIDTKAYEEYLELRSHVLLNEKKIQTLSDGRKVSLGHLEHRLKIIVQDLPEAEQKKILTLRKIYNTIIARANSKMRRAYGTHIDGEGKWQRTADKFVTVKQEMIDLFGRMFTAKEVHEIVVKQFNIPASLQSVINFREKHQIEISGKIEEHKRTFSDVRLGYKRSRLEELVWIYLTRKRIYEASKKGDDHRLLLMTLEQIRKEIEGDSLRINGDINVNIEATINQHIHKELFVNFPLKEIVMARVAARLKVSPTNLLAELNKSYYNTYLNQASNDGTEDMPAYPSTQTYDFDRIRRINIQSEQLKQLENSKIKVNDTTKVEKAESVKELLLRKLKNKSETVNFNKNKLSGEFIDKSNKG